MPFEKNISTKSIEYDHLNNHPTDNRVDNLVLAHKECNLQKRYFSRLSDGSVKIEKHSQARQSSTIEFSIVIPSLE